MIQVETSMLEHVPAVSLEERRDTLSARLYTGFDKIEEASRLGQDTTRWEQAWLRLLLEYEEVCDQIARRAPIVAH